MAGFDLKNGKYEARNASDDELWSAFACVFFLNRGMIQVTNMVFEGNYR